MGFQIDSVEMVIGLPPEKKYLKIIQKCQRLVDRTQDVGGFGSDDIILTGNSPVSPQLLLFSDDPDSGQIITLTPDYFQELRW